MAIGNQGYASESNRKEETVVPLMNAMTQRCDYSRYYFFVAWTPNSIHPDMKTEYKAQMEAARTNNENFGNWLIVSKNYSFTGY